MKDFLVKDFEKFLEISNTIESPFKFYEIINWYEGEKEVISVKASVWMRTALLSFEQDFDSRLKEIFSLIEKIFENVDTNWNVKVK
jgi:hypothetical protein